MKPVINVMLVLYIVTAVLPLSDTSGDWNWPVLNQEKIQLDGYEDYTQQLYLTAVEEELSNALESEGIDAQITITPSGNCMAQVDSNQWEELTQVLRQAGWQGGIIQEDESQ